MMTGQRIEKYREISARREEEFLSKGYKKRHCFPHTIYYLPKCGPDGLKLANRMLGEKDPNKNWELVLYAASPTVDEFPEELFFDDDLVLHQQQFGKTGQIATANLLIDGNKLYSMVHLSDIVQRISRRREYKTRIENRFKGWPYMLLNGILNFALENNLEVVCTPISEFAMEHTDPKREVQAILFERIYDLPVNRIFNATRNGHWWQIDVNKNRKKVVLPERKFSKSQPEKTICLCHDIERGLGHLGIDSELVKFANQAAPGFLDEMLGIERGVGIKATYNVVGCFLDEVREQIENNGHCIAFHSYDHNLDEPQLYRCQRVDYRMKGYRPPRSRMTPELNGFIFYDTNYEWLANGFNTLASKMPKHEDRIVKIPILFDDFQMS